MLYICLDFDGYQKQKDMLQDKEMFINNKFVLSVFVSPSGNGLKVLIKIPSDADNHIKYFTSLKTEFDSTYFDTTSKNISRVCYESYDPLLYYNPNSLVWDTVEEEEHQERSSYKDKATIKITDENKIVDILVKWHSKKYPMTEGQRNHNVYILAMALNDFGISRLIYTDINKDGTKSSPNLKETVKIAEISKCSVIISGGVSSIIDIKKAKELNNKNIEGIHVCFSSKIFYKHSSSMEACSTF